MLRVEGLWFRVQSFFGVRLGCRGVRRVGEEERAEITPCVVFRDEGLGFRVWGLRFEVKC